MIGANRSKGKSIMFKSHVLKAWGLGCVLAFTGGNVLAQNDAGIKESLDTYKDEVNSGMGVLSSRVAALESAGQLKVTGDVRVRHEVFNQKAQSAPSTVRIANRGRSRVRLRLGVMKQVGSEAYGAIGLATGSTTDPTSTNQTMDANFTEKGIYVDYGFLRWTPSLAKGRITVTGGKMKNPLLTSAVVWDGDTNPEGFAGEVKLTPKTFFRGGWLVLKENSAGREGGMNVFQFERGMRLVGLDTQLAIGYQFVPNSNKLVGGTPDMVKQGNVKNSKSVVPDFKVIDYVLVLKKTLSNKQDVSVKLHWARNMNSFDLFSPNGVENNNENAYAIEFAYGSVKEKKDILANIRWGYIEPNAVLSMFSDSDSEYNNRKYVRVQAGYGIAQGMELDLTGFGIRRVNYDLISPRESREILYRTQVDLVFKL